MDNLYIIASYDYYERVVGLGNVEAIGDANFIKSFYRNNSEKLLRNDWAELHVIHNFKNESGMGVDTILKFKDGEAELITTDTHSDEAILMKQEEFEQIVDSIEEGGTKDE